MEAIDTYYNGNYHRSRLEARWAFFFKELGIKYEYEPQGFKSNGEYYLPDFYLPDTYLRNESKGVYVEIKPDIYEGVDIKQSSWFDKQLVLFKGLPVNNLWDNWESGGFELYPNWDNCMLFWLCNNCRITKIEFAEGNYDRCPVCGNRCNNDFLLSAATLASKKRFEHGH